FHVTGVQTCALPIYGNAKNIITPAVKLLKTDHCANKATPIKVMAAPTNPNRFCVSTPHKKIMKTINKIFKSQLKYLMINLLRLSVFEEYAENFKISLRMISFKI